MSTSTTPAIPLPSLVSGEGPFRVESLPPELGGYSSTIPPLLGVPLANDDESIAVRMHEYCHLALARQGDCTQRDMKWLIKKGLRMPWIQALFDARVNAYAARVDSSRVIKNLPLPLPSVKPETIDRAILAQSYYRSIGLNQEDNWENYVEPVFTEHEKSILSSAFLASINTRKAPSCRKLLDLMLYLQSIFDGDKPPSPDDTKKGKGNGEKGEDKSFPSPFNLSKAFKAMGKRSNDWGKMNLVNLPLTMPKQRNKAPHKRPGLIGAFRYPHRALLPQSDGCAFGQRKKSWGQSGIILIDCSGSMSLSPKTVESLAAKVPCGIVAAYASSGDYPCVQGDLKILAKNGRIAKSKTLRDAIQSFTGGNVIDGPALSWLIAQRGTPKIWCCDGHVTGIGDHDADNLTIEAEQLVARGRIQRISTPDDVLEYLQVGGNA